MPNSPPPDHAFATAIVNEHAYHEDQGQTSNADSDLPQQMEALQIRLTFLDDQLEQLNAIVTRQDQQLQALQDQLRLLYQKLDNLQSALPQQPLDELPPHY